MPNDATHRAWAIDSLLKYLDVDMSAFVEADFTIESRFEYQAPGAAVLYYHVDGHAQALVTASAPIPLSPHTLILMPARSRMRLIVEEPTKSESRGLPPYGNDRSGWLVQPDVPYSAVSTKAKGIYGSFQARYIQGVDLFGAMSGPIVEQFDEGDGIREKLRELLHECATPEIGAGAMARMLLKQVLIHILRRFLCTPRSRREVLAPMFDPQIARAFAEMIARPGATHTLASLSLIAGLSRSAFISRFDKAFAASPIETLRQVRMRHAAMLLTSSALSVDQVARAVGYASRSSFFRTFRDTYGRDPSDYRRDRRAAQPGAASASATLDVTCAVDVGSAQSTENRCMSAALNG